MSEDLEKGAARPSLSMLGQCVVALDNRLRSWHSVFEYSSHPRCILRGQIIHLDHSLVLSDGTRAKAGDRLIDLHLWNEHVPLMPKQGASIGWARQMNACMRTSLRELAGFLTARPGLDDVSILRSMPAFAGRERSAQNIRLMSGYGFEAVGDGTIAGAPQRGRRLAENVLITLMVLAHNPASLRADTLRRDRIPLFMSRRVLERRYLPPERAANPRDLRS